MKKISTLLLVLMALLAPMTGSAEEVTFDFQNNPQGWPVGEGANFADGNLTSPLVVGEVTLTGIQGDATQPCRLMKPNDGIIALYVYKNGSIKFNAAEGRALTKIEVTMKTGSFDLTASTGAVADNVWTGNATEVVFNHAASGNRQMLKIVVTTDAENAETVKPAAAEFDVEAADIAAFRAAEDGKKVKLTLTNAHVNAVDDIFNYAYLEDASGAVEVTGITLTAGNVLNGYVIGTKSSDVLDYSNPDGGREIKLAATDDKTFTATAASLTATAIEVAAIANAENHGRLMVISNVEIKKEGRFYYAYSGEDKVQVKDAFMVLPTDYEWPANATSITGLVTFNGARWQIAPLKAADIVAAGVQPTEVTFDFSNSSLMAPGTKLTDPAGFIFNKTFTVDNVALQVTAGSAQSAIYTDASRGTCLAMFPMYAMMGITAPEGYAVTKIDFTQAGKGDLNMTPVVGAVEDHTWTGNSDVVYFTMPQKIGTAYLSKVTVTLAAKNAETSTATIDYIECANIAAFNALADGTPAKVTLTNAEVLGISANGYGTAWIQDATGGCLIQYSSLIENLKEKTKLNGVVYVILRKNSGNTQMKDAIDTPKSEIAATEISDYTIVEGTLAEVNVAANLNKLVKISGASFAATSATEGTLTQGDATIIVSNGGATANQQLHKITDTWTKDVTKMENVTIVAILTGKSDTVNQLLPLSMTEGSGDGIQNVNAVNAQNLTIYNLQGVRMNQLQKGINIVNGKKIVIK